MQTRIGEPSVRPPVGGWGWAVASSPKRTSITGRGKGQDAVEHKPLYRTSPATAGRPATVVHQGPGPPSLPLPAASCSFNIHSFPPRDTLTAYGPRFLESAGSVSPRSLAATSAQTMEAKQDCTCTMPHHPSFLKAFLSCSLITFLS